MSLRDKTLDRRPPRPPHKGSKIASENLPKVPNADEIEEKRVVSELFGSLWLMKSRVLACLDLKNRRLRGIWGRLTELRSDRSGREP